MVRPTKQVTATVQKRSTRPTRDTSIHVAFQLVIY
jgi:hypothetical protein